MDGASEAGSLVGDLDVTTSLLQPRRQCAFKIVKLLPIKGLGYITVYKPAIIYIVFHTCPLYSAQILVDGVNSQSWYSWKSIDISVILQCMNSLFVSLRNSEVHLQKNNFILRKILANYVICANKKAIKSLFRNKFVYFT